MNDQLNSAFMDDPEFQSLMIDCMESLQRGESIDRDALREKFPRYANDLDRYLDVLNVLDQFAGGLQQLRSGEVVSPYGATITPSSTNSDFDSGDTIRYIGEYEVLEEIARGGMGVVFKARQQTLKRIVALKMILSGRLADGAEIDRFRREAQAASRLKHPNIVAVHEIGEHEGRHYFTMDYVAGRSLAEVIRDESLAPRRAAGLVKTVAEAVHFAHQAGTLHRDLKPANILLTTDEVPHVTDFGLAKILDEVDDTSRAELTASGQILGTPSYMSPEQAAGKQNLVGSASDIYSLGAILYASLTGRAPFVADSPVDTLMQVMHHEPVAPRQLNPTVPEDLNTICLKCLNKEPHKRYGTAQELADDLKRYCEGRPVLARPVGRLERTWRWARRNPVVTSLLLLVATSLVAGTIVSTYFAIETTEALADLKIEESKTRQANVELAAERDQAIQLKNDASDARQLAEDRLSIVERTLFSSQLSRSYDMWKFQPTEAREGLLNETRCPPHLRDFSWRFVTNLTKRLERSYPGHDFLSTSIAISPDGKLFASCALNAKIQVCSRESGMAWEMDHEPKRWINRLAFLPDNRTLVSGGQDSVVTVWDALSGKKLLEAGLGEQLDGLAVSPDGKWIAAGGEHQIRLFGSTDLKRMKELPVAARELVFTPDGQTLIAGHGTQVVFINPETEEQRTWDGHEENITGMDVSPDGTLLISSDDSTVLLRDMETGNILQRVSETLKAEFRDVRFSPDGKTFATAAGLHPVKLWSVETGQAIGCVTPYLGSLNCLTFLPEGDQILTSGNPPGANLKLWNLPPADESQTQQNRALWMTASRDSNLLATTDQFQIQIWDFQTGEILHSWIPEKTDQIEGQIGHLLFLPCGTQLLSLHQKNLVALWDLDTQQLVRKFENLGRGRALAFDPLHQRIAVPGAEKQVSVRDFETGVELMALKKVRTTLQAVTFSPDGNWLAFGDGLDPLPDGAPAGQLQLRNLKTGESLSLQGHNRLAVYDLAFSPDGKRLVSVGVGGIVWEIPTGKLLTRLEGHQSTIRSVSFSPDGQTLATGSLDNTVRLWDPVTGESRLTLEGHPYWVTAVKFNHDGTRLASCSYDGQLRFWDGSPPQANQNAAPGDLAD